MTGASSAAAGWKPPAIRFQPVTTGCWGELAELFGPRGGCGGCWCTWWRLAPAEWKKNKGEGNRRTLRQIVDGGRPAGILGSQGGSPIAWCALAPRQDYPRLAASRILRPVDEQPVWSITCFLVAKGCRRQGLTVELLKAAISYARGCGARLLEGYPIEPNKRVADVFAFTGLASAFRKAGFTEIARRSPTRPIMRYVLGEE
ncbi:MAG TPA: GNAT family N-acetyltransferase [Terriglobales bacterium]|nr:GNAT family N-acetyltransferase [Terriglobales bacterium]